MNDLLLISIMMNIIFLMLMVLAIFEPKLFLELFEDIYPWIQRKKQERKVRNMQSQLESTRMQTGEIIFKALEENNTFFPIQLCLPLSVAMCTNKITPSISKEGYSIWRLQLLRLSPNDGNATKSNLLLIQNILYEYFRSESFNGLSVWRISIADLEATSLNLDFVILPDEQAIAKYESLWHSRNNKQASPRPKATPRDKEFE